MEWDKFEKIYRIYKKKYDIRFCKVTDYDNLIYFIDNYWQKGHIFTKSKRLFDWQHFDKKKERYNFVIAVDKVSNEIHGVIGFIMSSIYDENIEKPIRWGTIWKVRDDVGVKGLGLALKYYFEVNAPAKYVGGLGLSNYSKVINNKLGEQVGKMNLYYILNTEIERFVLIDNVNKENKVPQNIVCKNKSLKEIKPEIFIANSQKYYSHIPEFKSPLYYMNRYAKHPIYNYKFIEINNEHNDAIACLIVRKCEANDSCGLFVVDYIGNGLELDGLYNEFQFLLQKYNAEFISFYEYGLNSEGIVAGGFTNSNSNEIVIPLYFEPFVKKHIDLDYHFYTKEDNVNIVIFKGDADQDRPNKLLKE